MSQIVTRIATIVTLALAAAWLPGEASALTLEQLRRLSAEWVQWGLSIPEPRNPMTDETGADCGRRQRGPVWFLAGKFLGGDVTRFCTIPAGKRLFFPVANYFEFNSPGVCGSPEVTVAEMRQRGADFFANLTSWSVDVNGAPTGGVRRLRSPVFAVTLPENNVFDPLCAPENVPGGMYAPAIADGVYALI